MAASVSRSRPAASVLFPDVPLLLTKYILFEPQPGYVPLTVDVGLRDIATPEEIGTKLPPCR